MHHDEIIEEVRRIREAYAERFKYDLQAIHRDLKEQEKRSGRKTLTLPPNQISKRLGSR